MSNNSLSLDPRIIPLVRSLKEKEMEPSDNLSSNKIIKDISSEKTSENSAKLKENYKNLNGKNKKEEIKRTSKTKNSIRLPGKSNTIIRKKQNLNHYIIYQMKTLNQIGKKIKCIELTKAKKK